MEGEPSLFEGAAEQRKELSPEETAQDANRQKETSTRGNPVPAVRREPATRHDAVHVWVVLEVLAPGMEHCQEADVGPEVFGIGGDLLQGLGRGPKQDVVDNPLILQGNRGKRCRESEHHVKIFDREQLGFTGLDPLHRGGGPALGAVTIAA